MSTATFDSDVLTFDSEIYSFDLDENAPIFGWLSMDDSLEYLGRLYGAEQWATLSLTTREQLLDSAFDVIRDHPNYMIPAFGSDGWNTLTEDQQRKVAEAQALQALFIFANGADDDLDNMRARGVQSFGISKFNMVFGTSLRDKREFYTGATLAQKVKDKLGFALIDSPAVIGRFVRRYPIS